ncbi:MAG: hypothetical protein IT383_17675 [Deltaproteobacteria bacterium]|nr:hypothetical protein [Deltaproteobacteria bacterium]
MDRVHSSSIAAARHHVPLGRGAAWALPACALAAAVFLHAQPARAALCDDGDPCTKDLFTYFHCVHKPIIGCAPCATHDDCADPDNDLCTGTYSCDEEAGVCMLNASSVVTCDDSMDHQCGKNVCAPATGQCSFTVPTTPCDDGNPCSINDGCQPAPEWGGTCVGTPDVGPGKTCGCASNADCATQEDGDLCNGTLYCDKSAHLCKVNPATTIVCNKDSDTDCRKNTCAPALGFCAMTDQPQGTACSDGDACTVNDVCNAGQCAGVQDVGPGETCECVEHEDCAVLEDGDLCNGTLYCNKALHECLLNPATTVSCPSVDDTACSQNLCDPVDGKCKIRSVGTVCDDGNECTINDSCSGGQCQGTLSIGAGEHCACQSDADCLTHFDDGNACNGTLYCNLATNECLVNPATVIEPGVQCMQDAECPDGFHCAGALQANAETGASLTRLGVCNKCPTVDNGDCQASLCNPSVGACQLQAFDDGTECPTDGDPCSSGDACREGACLGQLDVGPGLTCECVEDSDCIDDGDVCNGTPYCDLSGRSPVCRLNPATVVTCPSDADNACTKNRCDAPTGECVLTPEPSSTSCSDDDPCTDDDHCEGGGCVGEAIGCACVSNDDCADDGDLCNGTPYCDHSRLPWACVTNPATIVTCADGDPDDCQERSCNPATGSCEVDLLDGGEACDDGDPCTGPDACASGACTSGAALCGANATCALEAGGLATCQCLEGWGPPGVCDTPESSDPCGGVSALGRCNGTTLEYCESGMLFTVACGSYEFIDATGAARIQAGTCLELDAGARCVFQAGEHCVTNSAHQVWGCGDNGGLAPDLGCDALGGCAAGLTTCDPTDPSGAELPRCEGTMRVHECSELGQLLGVDCAHPLVGGDGCVDGVCVGLVEGSLCMPGTFECASGLECQLPAPTAPTGSCAAPALPSSAACLAVPEWIGDGYCDASANTLACAWDDGDCCASSCAAGAAYPCGVAGFDCQDPDVATGGTGGTTGGCAAPSAWLADGYCDGSANNLACGWDDGDCCESTCVDATYACGTVSFDCQDPAVDEGDAVPHDWSCDAAWYGAVDGCDCECGAVDPDCSDPSATLYRCPVEATGCSPQGTCVLPSDPPDEPVDAGPEAPRSDAGTPAPGDPDAGPAAVPDAGSAEPPNAPDAGTPNTDDPPTDEPDPEEPSDGARDENGSDEVGGCGATRASSPVAGLVLLLAFLRARR